MNKMKIFLAVLLIAILIACTDLVNSDYNPHKSFISKNKFFIKTKSVLPISEASGSIIINGNTSFGNLNSKYKVKKISKVFKINGKTDIDVYNKLEMSRIYVAEFENENINMDAMLAEYANDDMVEYCEPVYYGFAAGEREKEIVPNDTYFSFQWYLKNSGNIKPSSGGSAKPNEDINMLKAWDVEEGSEDVIIAILDSGIEDLSPDLAGRLWTNTKEIPNNNRDDDGNGYADDINGWDFAYNDMSINDGFGHGTNIACVIGARKNDNFGFAGINTKSKLMICKNLADNNSGEYDWWAESIMYAVDNGAKIINMSEGGEDYSKVLKSAVDYAVMKDVFIAASMMNRNDGRNYYPAAMTGIFAVGAVDTDGRRCKKFSWGGGSCYGKHISVVAPGNKIYGTDYEDVYKFDTYWSGTSQATAIVSGLASLLLSQDRTRTAEEIKNIIKYTAIDQVGNDEEDIKGFDKYYGWGRIDCYAALTYNNDKLKTEIEKKYNNKETEKYEIKEEDQNYERKEKGARDKKSVPDTRNGRKPSEKTKPAESR